MHFTSRPAAVEGLRNYFAGHTTVRLSHPVLSPRGPPWTILACLYFTIRRSATCGPLLVVQGKDGCREEHIGTLPWKSVLIQSAVACIASFGVRACQDEQNRPSHKGGARPCILRSTPPTWLPVCFWHQVNCIHHGCSGMCDRLQHLPT